MQRIINDPDNVVDDALKGYLRASPTLLAPTDHPRVLKYAGHTGDKVGVVTGGGSGHEPAFLGYVGDGLCDAVAVGEIFSSPTADAFLEAFRVANRGQGVACLYGNYAGDNMNVKMARQMAELEDIDVKTVIARDDVASAPATQRDKRRGVAGEVMMWKIGGAAAARGDSLDEVIRLAQKAVDACSSIGVGLSSCTIPANGKPNFSIEPGHMELGIGHHGEPGIEVAPLTSADAIASAMCDPVLADQDFAGSEVAVLISGLGATPVMELNLLYAHVADRLEAAGVKVYRTDIGNYFTSLEMMGATLTLMKLDDELKPLLDAPARSLAITQR
ncbi:dihydroxyacetone kinase subunit DhaK [Chromohalobacter israelensis]|uniref:dihydroxyacetone kinase subunit DhaK n=1 Tax=Chromohalobacter israelensis TaxID=141390 RepID=UPI000FFE53C0|nr:dihydroxyacetone kinase subunit DhaK [Chromohalobacter salexigens]RXE46872.1 dihydroxyacetone kinase [Chromohalobacter salexigens]